jgi:hypothetical protein
MDRGAWIVAQDIVAFPKSSAPSFSPTPERTKQYEAKQSNGTDQVAWWQALLGGMDH